MSATLNVDLFSNYFEQVSTVHISGKSQGTCRLSAQEIFTR